MKKTFFHPLLKRFALLALATGTLFATAFSLTACGGGGDLSEDAILLRQTFERKYVAFEPQQVNSIMVEVQESNGTNNAFFARVQWGVGTGSIVSEGIFTIQKFTKNEAGKIDSFDFIISSHQATLNEASGFKHYWNIKDGAKGVVVTDVTFSVTDMKKEQGEAIYHGTFHAKAHWEGNDSNVGNTAISGDPEFSGAAFIYDTMPPGWSY